MLLVTAIVSILAGITIVAINPTLQFIRVRNSERALSLGEIYKGMQQYFIDHNNYPAATPTDLTEICNTSSQPFPHEGTVCGSLIDLSSLVPTYLVAIPIDPQGSPLSLYTGYKIMKDSGNKIVLYASQAELNEFIAIGTSTVSEETPVFCVSGDEGTTSTISGDLVYCDNVLQMWTSVAASGYTWGPIQDEPSDSCVGLGESYPACNYCDTLTYAGYSDWVLPTTNELVAALTEQFITVPPTMSDFAGLTNYWSSSENAEYNTWFAFYSSFSGNVYSNFDGKGLDLSVRCVR